MRAEVVNCGKAAPRRFSWRRIPGFRRVEWWLRDLAGKASHPLRKYESYPTNCRWRAGLYVGLWAFFCGHEPSFCARMAMIYWRPRS